MIDSIQTNESDSSVINKENIRLLFNAILDLQARVKELEP